VTVAVPVAGKFTVAGNVTELPAGIFWTVISTCEEVVAPDKFKNVVWFEPEVLNDRNNPPPRAVETVPVAAASSTAICPVPLVLEF
jgi:hypothetical protein